MPTTCVIDCRLTFESGQVFEWREAPREEFPHPSPTYLGVVGESVVAVRAAAPHADARPIQGTEMGLGMPELDAKPEASNAEAAAGSPQLRFSREHKPAPGVAEVAVVAGTAPPEAALAAAKDLLRASLDMRPLVASWSAADPAVAAISAALPGLRVLRQDPWQCLVSFICSSNNNIARIMQMLAALRQRFGRPLPSVGGLAFAAFPSAERLAAAEEAELRALGLGYRAKFVISTAKRVQSLGGESWLASLRGLTRQAATTELQSLAGVGPKVADCVALFSLDQASAIPVDTHVWAIACRDMDPSLKQAKSLTPKVYDRVVQLFTDRFGAHAGWAHCVLFSAELPAFRRELPEPMQRAIEAFAAEERAAKAAKRRAKRARTADADEPAKRARAPKRQRESIPESTGGTGP